MKNISLSRWLILLLIGITAVSVSLMLLFSAPKAATGYASIPNGTSQPLIIAIPVTTTTPSATPTLTEALFLPAILQQPTPTATPTATAVPVTCLPDPPLGASDAAVDTAVTNAINQERSDNGQSAYLLNDKLTQAARRHAYDMAQNNITSHTGSDGSSTAQRINEACYGTDFSGEFEIIGWGFPTVSDMMNFWMSSDDHRPLILHTTLEEIGVAYVFDSSNMFDHLWTVTFGKPTTTFNSNAPQYVCTKRIEEATRGISASWVQSSPCDP